MYNSDAQAIPGFTLDQLSTTVNCTEAPLQEHQDLAK